MDDNENQSLLEGLQSDSEGAELPLGEQDLGMAAPADLPADLPNGEPLPSEALAPAEGLAPAEISDPSIDMPEPGESSNPELALEQMLSAAAEDVPPYSLAEEATSLPESPLFQLHFSSVTAEARAQLKGTFEAQGVSLSDKAWELGQPVVSQLTEFQALSLYQVARRLGLSVRMRAAWPGQSISEDDLALGDLSGIPDPESLLLEAASSVTLPKDEKEVLLCTADSLPNYPVRETRGLVSAHSSLPRRLFREEEWKEKLEKELRQLPGRQGQPLPASQLQVVLRNLFLDLQKCALAQGANSVLGVKLEAFPETSHLDPQLEQLRLVAFGTAAVVEKA